MQKGFLVLLLIIYIVPVIRLVTWVLPKRVGNFFLKFNALIGRYEWFIGPPRDLVFSFILIGLALFHIIRMAMLLEPVVVVTPLIYLAFASLSIYARHLKSRHRREMILFVHKNPSVCPREFFNLYYAGYGPLPIGVPSKASRVIDPRDVSFKKGGRPRCGLHPILPGIWNTHTLARLIWESYKWKGADFCKEVADSFAALWGARVLELAQMELITAGIERLENLSKEDASFIFVFNHHSFLDFAVSPLALSAVKKDGGPRFKLRYLAAKDHFKDNYFLYRVLGLGRALEAVGTIFVERRRKARDPGASIAEAARFMLELGVDIAIYPQGTRAYGNVNWNGERIDGGYYAVGSLERLKRSDAHIKKGAAYLALEVLSQIRGSGKTLYIVPVGLMGTGVAVPRGSVKIRTEATVNVVVGEPLKLKPEMFLYPDVGGNREELMRNAAADLTNRIDKRMRDILEIDSRLEHRFFTDLRKILSEEEMEHVAVAMKAWRNDDYIVYKILDFIYSLPPKMWEDYLRRLSHLLMKTDSKMVDELVKLRSSLAHDVAKMR